MLNKTRTLALLQGLVCVAALGVSAAIGDEAKGNADIAKSVAAAKVTLQQGLTAAESRGQPISAKFEVDEGKFQLSVYTAQGNKFSEVIVDHQTGKVADAEIISEKDDLAAAKSQAAAMARAKTPLKSAVDTAEKSITGSRAVSVTPKLKEGHASAVVSLLKDGKYTSVSEPLE